jgi:anti-anti-sigma factor
MRPLNVFYSYSHHDEKLRDELEIHLTLLRRQGLITNWHDRMIDPGQDWKNVSDDALESADLVLLLVSPSFIASDYCYDVEVQRAIERHDAGQARVIPIIARPVDWIDAPFGKLQALPTNGKPITTWRNRDAAFKDIVDGIRMIVKKFRRPRKIVTTFRGPGPPHLVKDEQAAGVTVIRFSDRVIDSNELLIRIEDELLNVDYDKHYLLNMSRVEFATSSMLSIFILLNKRVNEAGGQVKFCCLNPKVMEVFRLSKLDRVFEVYSDERAAIESYTRAPDGSDGGPESAIGRDLPGPSDGGG